MECACGTVQEGSFEDHKGGTASCTAKAKCSECGEEYGELGAHGDTEIKDKKDATCTADGYTGDTYCTVCGEKIANGTKINALGHGETEIKDAKDATCTTEGYTGDTYCKVCKQTIGNGAAIDALGHDYAEKLTAGTDTHYYACSRCDSKKDEAAHVYKWVTDKEPTTSASGMKHEECACGAKRNENTPIPQLATPPTGDKSQLLLWTVLLTFSGLAALAVCGKKRKAH